MKYIVIVGAMIVCLLFAGHTLINTGKQHIEQIKQKQALAIMQL